MSASPELHKRFGTKRSSPTITAWDRIKQAGVLPVVEVPDAATAVELATTLQDVGLDVIEIAFRTPSAAEAIAAVRARCPELLVGAGTIVRADQLDQALQSGAAFVVSPGFSPAVVSRCMERSVPVLPGVCTPTEIQMGIEAGLDTLKFFPAEAAGGVTYLRALAGPFANMSFVPTGGVTADNLASYLSRPNVSACGGSWFVAKDLLVRRDFDTVGRLASEALRIVAEVRHDAGV